MASFWSKLRCWPRRSRAKKESRWHRRLVQQRLRGWSPILHPRLALYYFLAVGVFCLAVGIPILVASLNVVKYSVRYDQMGPFAGLSPADQQNLLLAASSTGVPVTLSIQVSERMRAPIIVSYEVDSMYQNYRRYVRSYDAKSMHDGLSPGDAGPSACRPFQYLPGGADAGLPNGGAILPCGQIAQSLFNDSFSATVLAPGAGAPVELPIDSSAIAWSSDRKHLYGDVVSENFNTVPALRGGGALDDTPLNQAQHWMVWQRVSASSRAEKLYGRIETDLEPGSRVILTAVSRYNSYVWGGSKTIILSTNSWMGGRNLFLGAVYITVGGLAWIAAALLFASSLGLFWKRPFGDMSLLSWNKKAEAKRLATARVGSAPITAPPMQGTHKVGRMDADGLRVFWVVLFCIFRWSGRRAC